MKNLLNACFGKKDKTYVEYLQLFMDEADNYKKVYKVKNILKDKEREYFKYLIQSYNSSGETPSVSLFESVYPETKGAFANTVAISIMDLRVYVFNLIDARINAYISERMAQLNQKVKSEGITSDVADEINKLQALSNRNKAKDISISIDAKEEYNLLKMRPSGLITGIKEIDKRIGGMNMGTVNTIAGFTGQYKCVSKNERVLTDKGFLTMEEIYHEFHSGSNENRLKVQSEFGLRDLVSVHDEGVKDSCVVYIGGIPVETSPVHRFRVWSDLDYKFHWIEAQNLEVGDRILQSLKESGYVGSGGSSDLWYHVGIAYMSGFVRHALAFFTNNKFDIDSTPQLENISMLLRQNIENLVFPEELFYLSVDCWKSFVKGLYSVSGFIDISNPIIPYHKKEFLISLSRLLSGLGISSSLVQVGYLRYHLVIKGKLSNCRFINIVLGGFSCDDTSDFLGGTFEEGSKELYEVELASLTYGVVTSIEKSSCYMYDLTVEGSPTYLLNGYVTHNTTWSLNIARLNAYELGYNIAYISLETPKQDMNWNLLSRHSYESHLSRFQFVGHDRMRHCELTPEEEDFVFNEVSTDLTADFVDRNGVSHKRGRVIILDESDFNTFSFGEITAVLEKVDDELGGNLDAFIIDYVQLCKFSGSGMSMDANAQINSYVTFFRRLSQNFRKVIDANGNEKVKQLTAILLAQLNRTGWQKAVRNKGVYQLDALADANELERGSARIFTVFTTEDMKARKSAQVQILKNRMGQTLYEPVPVFADGECYLFMDEDSQASDTWGGSVNTNQSTMEAAFSGMNMNNFGSFEL